MSDEKIPEEDSRLPLPGETMVTWNPEHLAKLKESIETWNFWRTMNPEEEPNLSRATFSEATLSGAKLHGANLKGAGSGLTTAITRA